MGIDYKKLEAVTVCEFYCFVCMGKNINSFGEAAVSASLWLAQGIGSLKSTSAAVMRQISYPSIAYKSVCKYCLFL